MNLLTFPTNVQVRAFFQHRFYVRACGCGEVFGFRVVDALEYLGKKVKGWKTCCGTTQEHMD